MMIVDPHISPVEVEDAEPCAPAPVAGSRGWFLRAPVREVQRRGHMIVDPDVAPVTLED